MDRSGKGSVFQVETNGAGHRCFSIDAHLRGTRRGEGLLGPGFPPKEEEVSRAIFTSKIKELLAAEKLGRSNIDSNGKSTVKRVR